MKRMLAVAVILAAGCSAEKPKQSPASPETVVLATFTGEVDVARGTFVVTTDPTIAGRAAGFSTHLVVPEPGGVTVANSGLPWNKDRSPTGACGGVNVTGANVIVTQQYASPVFLGAVYASIDELVGTGVNGCNSDPVPNGVTAPYGNWSYGRISQGSPVTKEWDFVTGTTARFIFKGKIRPSWARRAAPSSSAPTWPTTALRWCTASRGRTRLGSRRVT